MLTCDGEGIRRNAHSDRLARYVSTLQVEGSLHAEELGFRAAVRDVIALKVKGLAREDKLECDVPARLPARSEQRAPVASSEAVMTTAGVGGLMPRMV